MKIKTNKKRAFCILFAFVLFLGIGCYTFAVSSPATYALTEEGYPETFEEFDEQIGSVREKRAELQEKLDVIREYEHVKAYQEIWDIIEDYIATEEIGEWKVSKVGFISFYAPGNFTYDETLFNNLIAIIQKYDPDFRLADNVQHNSIVSSLSNITVTEIATVTYDMLYLGHIDLMLTNRQEYFDKNIGNSTRQRHIVSKFFEAANDEFEEGFAIHTRMAELYNRIMSRNTFVAVHEAFRQWQEQYNVVSAQFSISYYILSYGEELTSERYFPDKIQSGFFNTTFSKHVARKFQDTYTLEELVRHLSDMDDSMFPEPGREAITELFEGILATEMQNLKASLLVLNPTLTDLDDKTTDELLEIARNSVLDKPFGYLYENASPEIQDLTSLLIEFHLMALGMFSQVNPADKYFSTTNLLTTYAEVPAVDTLSEIQIRDNTANHGSIFEYYGRIGKAAAAIDPTVIYELYPHEDWPEAVAPVDSDGSENPSISNTDPNRPNSDPVDSSLAGPKNPSNNSSVKKDDSLLPNTGVIGFISNNATAAIGIVTLASAFIILSLHKIRKLAIRDKE